MSSTRIIESWGCRLVVTLAVLSASSSAGLAGDLRNFITDLYTADTLNPDGAGGVTVEPFPPGQPSVHQGHFQTDSLTAFQSLSEGIGASAGIVSINPAFESFTFDVSTGVPVKTTESLGPLVGERAPTLGKDKINLAFSVTRADFQSFEGQSLDDSTLIFPHEDEDPPGSATQPWENDVLLISLNLDVEQTVFAFYGTYGITDRWDAGLVVPLVYVKAEAKATGQSLNASGLHPWEGTDACVAALTCDSPNSEAGGDAFGVGDVLARTKFNFLRDHDWAPDLSIAGQVAFPSGDEDDLLGTGEFEVLPILIASKPYGIVTPHLNFGYEFSTGDFDAVRYAVGADVSIFDDLSTSFDFVGRHFTESDELSDLLDVGVGVKWDPIGGVPFAANVLIPVNYDEGLRSYAIWTLGLDVTF